MSDSQNTRYNFRESESHWQQQWEKKQLFEATEKSDKPKFYVMEMFPYPSGRIHMGHVRNYTLGDVTARFKRAQGFNVLHPMGWDAFGLPAENAAIQNNAHPSAWTYSNIDAMREQLKSIGVSYDWGREIATCDADYYQHEQRFFLEMLREGIAYRKESWVNWDPVDHTVLANEQVIDGCGWRSGAAVERKQLSQWFLPISQYGDELLEGLESLQEWPDRVRLMQENWIGRSEGAIVHFDVENSDTRISVYTTRPDTLFGMAFLAVAANHPIAAQEAQSDPKLAAFIKECESLGTSEEAIEKADKKGYRTRLSVEHPFTGESYPVYVANFVLMDYGTGAVFGCPAHDERDHAFASKYDLPIRQVISAPEGVDVQQQAYTGEGQAIDSDFLNDLPVNEAKTKAIDALQAANKGERKINFRLRDWGISRQRYWGCPIPIIYCDDCDIVPVPDAQLPVTLPKDVNFDTPGNPLDKHPTWKHVDCPQCGNKATRETDTFDTFFESSWYFLRYCSPRAKKGIDRDAADYWMPVDRYIGGIEHAVLHLLYARFFTRILGKLGYTKVKEPFKGLFTQGMICHETYKDNKGNWLEPSQVQKSAQGLWHVTETGTPVTVGRSIKMSKSKKNTVDPRYIIATYGADAARLFMMSDSPPERDLEWSDAGIDGAWRYINRLYRLVQQHKAIVGAQDKHALPQQLSPALSEIRAQVHKTIKHVAEDIDNYHFNKAVARIRELSNALAEVSTETAEQKFVMQEALETLLHLIAPFMPHLAETLWSDLGHSDLIASRPWPEFDQQLVIEDTVTIAVQVNGKLRATIQMQRDIDKQIAEKTALAEQNVQTAISGKQVVKTIVVPNRIVNVVVK
ncbi:MAG: leucine--tRNA ligase [Alphaproteobacteria bacterium]|nr:leucine--tRNA ligase [Alphaproteobacteria bacterium]